jgi:hypothetical protein
MDYNLLINNTKQILNEIEFTEPFSFFYKHKSYTYNNYYINVCKKNIYEPYLSYTFDSGILERNEMYSTHEIPVYTRREKEVLHYLFNNRYYTSLNINNIIIDGDNIKNYNPSTFDSYFGDTYVITKTIEPAFKKHLIIYEISKEEGTYNTPFDFYYDYKIINKLYIFYRINVSLNKQFCLLNSLEAGSLPEILHSHVFSAISPDIDLTNLILFTEITPYFYKIYGSDIDNEPFANSYLINLNIFGENYEILTEKLKIIPTVLYNCRYDNKTNSKYVPALLFFMNKNINYLMIYFRKVSIYNIKLNEDNTNYIPEYYNEMFGTSIHDNIIYLPNGLVTYRPQNVDTSKAYIKEYFNNNANIKKIKNVYHHCLKFEELLVEYYNNPEPELLERTIINRINEGVINNNVCVNLNQITEAISLHRWEIILDNCIDLPILYKLNNILTPVIAIEKPLANQIVSDAPNTTTATINTTSTTEPTSQINPTSTNNASANTTSSPLPTTQNNTTQVVPVALNLTPHQQFLLEKITEIQSKPIEQRTRELFMEIDQLGNYTQESWFSNLTENGLVHYFRYLYDIWRYRGQLSSIVKTNICSLRDPFHNIRLPMQSFNIDVLRKECLTVMEYMVYTGINVEYQKIGALHVLSALTLVSIPARQSMYWLYEGLLY